MGTHPFRDGGEGEAEGGGYSLVYCRSHATIDYASLFFLDGRTDGGGLLHA